ncbi:MAG: ribonuclease R [Lachnospiraceae bacterium]|nr:ribonuclease R [Lachnospiraceae bacterium]
MEENRFQERKDMILSLMNEKEYVPMKLKELAILLNVPRENREELKAVLDALIAEGKIGVSKKGKYAKAEIFAQKGVFSAHPRGFGFVTIEGREDDVFVAPDNVKDAMDGDTVQVVVDETSGNRRAEAVVIRVLVRANETIIGTFEKSRHFGFVIPDNPRITADVFIPEGMEMGAVSGHKVVVRLTSYGGERKNPEGRITEILGHVNDPGVDIFSIVRAYNLPEGYPEEVLAEAAKAPEALSESEILAELERGRVDLRDTVMVTIDGEDAKDLDDAVSISKEVIDGHPIYHLGVHIADVTHYVKEDSALDKEALKRGTSVYLVDRVIPMLPHRLSNGICSLNAGCDRFALSCLMDVDEKGNIVSHRICESVVRIDRRMTYTTVHAILRDGAARKESGTGEYADLVPMFLLMNETAQILRKKRMARGAVDFDFPECKIILDEKGRPTDIRPYERNDATMLIEDFMLAANETVAEEYYWQQVPFLYRTHEKPDEEKIRRFGILINNFGYSIRLQNGELHPKEMQKLLAKVSGTPEEALLSRLALRSMKQAKYTTECVGHFGLAAKYYTHFTSPIRRYPDLQIHRIIKENLHGELNERRLSHYERKLGEVAVWTSARERLADEAERETDKAKKVQYMERHIGDEYDGVISGISNYGFYVELPNTVEGMVRVSELDGDYYVFDESRYELIGERTGKSFKLGQQIRIRVVSVDRFMKTIDFQPVKNF